MVYDEDERVRDIMDDDIDAPYCTEDELIELLSIQDDMVQAAALEYLLETNGLEFDLILDNLEIMTKRELGLLYDEIVSLLCKDKVVYNKVTELQDSINEYLKIFSAEELMIIIEREVKYGNK